MLLKVLMVENVPFVWPVPALSRFFTLRGRQTPLFMLSPKVHEMLLEFKRLLVFSMKQSDPALLIGVWCPGGFLKDTIWRRVDGTKLFPVL